MSRSGHIPSKAELRDAELAEIESAFRRAAEYLDAMKAEIGRSNRLLDQMAMWPEPAGDSREPCS
jgi:hypothetical protein